jgi:hypothetical protein
MKKKKKSPTNDQHRKCIYATARFSCMKNINFHYETCSETSKNNPFSTPHFYDVHHILWVSVATRFVAFFVCHKMHKNTPECQWVMYAHMMRWPCTADWFIQTSSWENYMFKAKHKSAVYNINPIACGVPQESYTTERLFRKYQFIHFCHKSWAHTIERQALINCHTVQ